MDNHFIILISIITFGFILLVLFAVNNFTALGSNFKNNSNTISVSATGTASSAPDELTIVLSAKVDDPSPQKAVSGLAVITNKILNSLKNFNVESVQTTSYNLYQNTYCPPECQPFQPTSSSPPSEVVLNLSLIPVNCRPCIANGVYEASEEITIKTLNLSSGGGIIDAAVNAGANNVERVSFGFSDNKSNQLSLQALNDSLLKAKQKASTIASTLNLKITGVQNVYLNNYYYPQPLVFATPTIKNSVETSIIPGNQTVTANVEVVFSTS